MAQVTGIPLYGHGMVDFIYDELELGTLAAMAIDAEACGFGPLFDALVEEDLATGRFVW